MYFTDATNDFSFWIVKKKITETNIKEDKTERNAF
jgi:hypothetical protein